MHNAHMCMLVDSWQPLWNKLLTKVYYKEMQKKIIYF